MPELTLKLPENWEQAYGYKGKSRYLMIWWEPGGDEAMYSDGRMTTEGNWWVYSKLMDYLFPSYSPYRYLFGSSDQEGTRRLILDLETRQIRDVTISEGWQIVNDQHPIEERPMIGREELLAALSKLNEAQMEREDFLAQHDMVFCPDCQGGWLVQELADGFRYEKCETCKGEGHSWVKRDKPMRVIRQGSMTTWIDEDLLPDFLPKGEGGEEQGHE